MIQAGFGPIDGWERLSVARDYYGMLGLSTGASDSEIKRAYRKLARELHPDVNPDEGAQTRFKEISVAYEVLSDPDKRRIVDMGGDPMESVGAGGGGGFAGFGGLGDGFEGDGAVGVEERLGVVGAKPGEGLETFPGKPVEGAHRRRFRLVGSVGSCDT